MKKIKFSLILMLVCFALIGCAQEDETEGVFDVETYDGEESLTYDYANDNLEFHFNADTTQFTVVHKKV